MSATYHAAAGDRTGALASGGVSAASSMPSRSVTAVPARAERPRPILRAGKVGVEQAGRADRRQDVAAPVIGDDDGDGELRAEAAGAILGERLERGLQVAVDGELVDGKAGLVGDRLLGE